MSSDVLNVGPSITNRMSANLNRFLAMIGAVGIAGGLLLAILTSSLSEAQKYFGATVFLLIVVFLYGEAFYQKKRESKKVVKDSGPQEVP